MKQKVSQSNLESEVHTINQITLDETQNQK